MASLERVGERTGYRQRVVFSGHIAPAHFLYTPSCYEAYHEIARRYAPMIVMHTFGHTNFDYFDLVREPRRYRDHETHAAAGLLLTAPPVVPYWNHATFRVYDYDVRQLLDYRQYHADLDRGNVERKLTFQLSYSFRDAYGVASMSPDEMHRVRQSLITNVTMSTEFLERMLGQDRGWVDRILGHVHDPEETWRFKKKWRKAMTLFCDRIDIDSADDDCRRMFYPNETATTVPESLTVTDLADEKHLMIDD